MERHHLEQSHSSKSSFSLFAQATDAFLWVPMGQVFPLVDPLPTPLSFQSSESLFLSAPPFGLQTCVFLQLLIVSNPRIVGTIISSEPLLLAPMFQNSRTSRILRYSLNPHLHFWICILSSWSIHLLFLYFEMVRNKDNERCSQSNMLIFCQVSVHKRLHFLRFLPGVRGVGISFSRSNYSLF